MRDQYGNEEVLRARLYHPFVDAVKRLVEPCGFAPVQQPQQQQQQGAAAGAAATPPPPSQPVFDVDLYRASDVSLISLQNSPAACGLNGGELLLLYRYGRCSREYWQQQNQPERGAKPTFAGLYVSDYKNQVGGIYRCMLHSWPTHTC